MTGGREGLCVVMRASLLLLFALSMSCKGCHSSEPQAPPVVGALVPEEGIESESEIELGIADTSLLPFAGEKDFKNRYASVVMVSFSGEPGAVPQCSGVLTGSRLVLTAGSCVCKGKKLSGTGGSEKTLIDGAACVKQAFVTTVTHGERENPVLREPAEREFRTYRGEVHPHPELQVILDAQDSIVSSRADLAAIQLDESVEGQWPMPVLTTTEVHVGQSLVMAGFAHDPHGRFGGLYGVRYSRKNPVTRVLENGRVLYRQQGPYLYDGYFGGPCLQVLPSTMVGGSGPSKDPAVCRVAFLQMRCIPAASWILAVRAG